MTAIRPPVWRRRWFDPVAVLVIGVLVVGAGLLPAATANSGETVTIRGDVAVGGTPLAFFPVGFWVPGDPPADGVLTTTQTDATGRFTMEVPTGRDGFAFAGVAPDADRAVVSAGSRQVVRGVIGTKAAAPVSSPLYQGFAPATGRSLAQGGRLHFALQPPGRIAGTSPLPASAVTSLQVRRLDGSVVQALRPDARGRFQSAALAPGAYGVALVPKAPALPVVVAAAVRPGAVTAVRLARPVAGAVLAGTVRTADGPVPAGVPVLLERDGRLVARATTSSGGRYSIPGVAAGPYRLEAGRYDVGIERAAAADVPIPGRTSTPTPAPTPAPTAPPAGPQAAALTPVERTSDAVRPTSIDLEVPETLGSIDADVQVEAAGRISGTVTGAGADPVEVVVEDPETGQVLRATTASASGGYAIGGLVQETRYRVLAVSRPTDPTAARTGTATAVATTSTSGVDLALDGAAGSITGSVAGTTSGSVAIGGAVQRTGRIQQDGTYRLDGLVPGAYPVIVSTPGRVSSQPVAAVLPAAGGSVRLDLQPGPRPAAFRGWFISGGAGVPVVRGSATSATGDVVRLDRSVNGHVEASGLAPGSYAYDVDAFQGTVPAVDGPWFFLPPAGTFRLSDGATTDVQAVVLHVRAR